MTARIYERLSEVYDVDWGQWPRRYTGFIQELLRQAGTLRASVLDLACGTGTLARELGACGHAVLGVDICPEMIEIAESKAADLPHVSFRVADMRRFEIDDRFGCVTCTFDSLNYLLHLDDLRATFERVGDVLEPGGFFVFDCNTDRLYLAHHHGAHERDLGGHRFLQKLHYDPEERIATTTFVFSNDTEETHVQRPYTLDEVRPVLVGSGFTIERAMSGLHGQPYTGESERLVCVARRARRPRDSPRNRSWLTGA